MLLGEDDQELFSLVNSSHNYNFFFFVSCFLAFFDTTIFRVIIHVFFYASPDMAFQVWQSSLMSLQHGAADIALSWEFISAIRSTLAVSAASEN